MARLLAVLAVALVAATAHAGGDKTYDKTFALPVNGGMVALNTKIGDLVLTQVAVRNVPNKGDYDKAKKDPTESCHPKFQVRMSNPSKEKLKIKVVVKLEDAGGKELLACDTTEKFDPGTKDFDSNLCWLQSIKVNDWPKARLHVIVTLK